VPLLAGVVGGIVANVQLSIIPSPAGTDQGLLAGFAAMTAGTDIAAVAATLLLAAGSFYYIRRKTQVSVDKGIKTFLVVLGSVVAFSSGGSQVGLATGPLENLYRVELGLPGLVLLALGALGILGGAWMGAPRLLQATSREYAQLGVRRSIAALVPASSSPRPPSRSASLSRSTTSSFPASSAAPPASPAGKSGSPSASGTSH